ncbi:MAG: thiamine pyrophosphate-binding protein [Pseudomonadota bacterium]
MAKTTGGHLLAQALEREGVEHIFTVAGDHTLPFLDVLADSKIKVWDTRHEAAAVHMGEGYSRATGKAAVCVYTTPGHANAIAGLAHALHGEAPIISISGCAESYTLGKGAMQEIDQIGMAKPLTKGAWMVPSTERMAEHVHQAFRHALTGRRGPVHLTIPVDYQEQSVDAPPDATIDMQRVRYRGVVPGDLVAVAQAVALLKGAERPAVIASDPAGYGCKPETLQRFIEAVRAPLFTEGQARGSVPDDHPLCFGLFDNRMRAAGLRIKDADVVVLLGKKLESPLGFGAAFSPSAKIVQIDPDIMQIGRNRQAEVGIVGDIGEVLEQMIAEAKKHTWKDLPWVSSLREAHDRQVVEFDALATGKTPMHPMDVAKAIMRVQDRDMVMVFDGGNFSSWVRSCVPAYRPGRWGGLTTLGMLGSGLPMALGVQVALPGTRVLQLTGDGSFGFNAMELDTAARMKLPVVSIVGTDSAWTTDKAQQVGIYGRAIATDLEFRNYELVAQGLGCHGELVEDPAKLSAAIERAFASGKPALLNVPIRVDPSGRTLAAVKRKTGK